MSFSISAYEIGHRSIPFTDTTRNRDIQTEVYYPADISGDDVPFSMGSFPVVVFGHGFVISWDSYSFVWNALVEEGYIVLFPRTEGGISPDHNDFGLDLTFLIDHVIEQGNNNESFFYNHVDDMTAIMGHSMGGGASFLGANESDQITVISNFAAAETNPSAIAAAESIDLPALLFAGTEDCITPPENHQIPMYDALISPCKTIVTIAGGSHCQFAENNGNCTFAEFISGCSADIDQEEQENRTLALLVPWLNHFLKNEPGSWLNFQFALNNGASAGDWSFQQNCPQPTITPTPTSNTSPTATTSPTPLVPTPTPLPSIPVTSPGAMMILILAITFVLLLRK